MCHNFIHTFYTCHKEKSIHFAIKLKHFIIKNQNWVHCTYNTIGYDHIILFIFIHFKIYQNVLNQCQINKYIGSLVPSADIKAKSNMLKGIIKERFLKEHEMLKGDARA